MNSQLIHEIHSGVINYPVIRKAMESVIGSQPQARIDYIEIRDGETLEPVDRAGEGTLIALAVFIGQTRLIDNLVFAGQK